MKKIVGVFAVLALAACASAAPQQCSSLVGTNVNLISSCLLGPYLFSNFLWDPASIGPTQGPVTLSGIFSDPTTSTFGLTFNPNLVGGVGAPADVHLTFNVTNAILPGVGNVWAVGLIVPGGPANTGTTTHVQENGCTAPFTTQDSGACPGATVFSVSAFPGQTLPLNQVTPTPTLYIWKDINASDPLLLHPQLTSFTELFQVPEPATIALFGAGLLALGLARRKRRL